VLRGPKVSYLSSSCARVDFVRSGPRVSTVQLLRSDHLAKGPWVRSRSEERG